MFCHPPRAWVTWAIFNHLGNAEFKPRFCWVLLKAGLRPSGPAARRPSPDFPQFFFCPAVNPRACTDLHRVWACKMDDREFEFVYHFKRIQTHRRPFCTPKPDADLWMLVDLPLDKKTVENQDWATGPPDHRAAGPPGCGAVAGRGPRAAGRLAFGPPGRCGPWAAGLLLAKPGSVDGFRWKGLQTLATFDSLSVQMRLEERSRIERRTLECYFGGIWRQLEPLERIYSCFPSVDPLGRFAGIPSLGKPYT